MWVTPDSDVLNADCTDRIRKIPIRMKDFSVGVVTWLAVKFSKLLLLCPLIQASAENGIGLHNNCTGSTSTKWLNYLLTKTYKLYIYK
jgi:hypothetical protein